jgi:hypothetical protein
MADTWQHLELVWRIYDCAGPVCRYTFRRVIVIAPDERGGDSGRSHGPMTDPALFVRGLSCGGGTAAHGHTPGHCTIAIEPDNQRMLHLADITNIPMLFVRNWATSSRMAAVTIWCRRVSHCHPLACAPSGSNRPSPGVKKASQHDPDHTEKQMKPRITGKKLGATRKAAAPRGTHEVLSV